MAQLKKGSKVGEGLVATPGTVMFFAGNKAPEGWLKCNGAALSRTTYSDLFAAIGTTFGAGDGSTTFNIPDLRGEFIRGFDDGRGIDSGRIFGSWQADELKSHTHTPTWPGTTDDGTLSPRIKTTKTVAGTNDNNYNAVNATGGTETRPRNVALLACIRY